MVQAADFGSFAIRHSGSRDLFGQVRDAIARIMDEVSAIMNCIESWKGIILPRSVQLDFAREAAELKPNPNIPFSWLLTARRDENMTRPDASRDLWRTFNAIQESLLRGGMTGRNERGRRVTTRLVKAVEADLRINRKLWLLAENFANNQHERGRVRPPPSPCRQPSDRTRHVFHVRGYAEQVTTGGFRPSVRGTSAGSGRR